MYIPWPVPSTPQTPSNEVQIVCPSREYLALLKLALSSSSSQTAVGILAMGFLELSSTFAHLCHLVDEVISDMQNEI
ncbi:transmembrane GTPase Marf [Trichonephila clavata]|uniref:Transmembrane GTPase Marf n=1 Tax=Trichonephila clavata TaxID=2740835 RepID=A0A8X6LFF2_TRICU|nr:transmembrane GTPase Marf [Trichonephila clavata]